MEDDEDAHHQDDVMPGEKHGKRYYFDSAARRANLIVRLGSFTNYASRDLLGFLGIRGDCLFAITM